MSLAEVDRLSAANRVELARHLRARELVEDPQRTADASARLDRALLGKGVVGEDEVRWRVAGLRRTDD